MSKTARVDGQTVTIGDYVSFKSDVEQGGTITDIKRCSFRGAVLVLESEHGFHGDYIGGQTVTEERAKDCWIEG